MPKKKQSAPSATEAIAPIYVVSGKDRRRMMDTLDNLIEQTLEGADPQVALSEHEGDQVATADVLDDLRTLPFLSPRRVVVVKDADSFISQSRELLERYLETPSPTGVLIMTASRFPGNTRLAKATAKVGRHIPCDPPSARDLPGYLSSYAQQRHQAQLIPQAAQLLIEQVGDDCGQLCSEIDKLVVYLQPSVDDSAKAQSGSVTIDIQAVQELIGQNRQYNAFNVIDAMINGDASLALERLDHMLRQDRSAEFTAVGAFAWHVRRLYNARVLLDKRVNPREISKQLRIWYNTGQFMQQVSRLPLPRIAEMLKALMRIDRDSKSGAGSVHRGLETFIVRLTASTG